MSLFSTDDYVVPQWSAQPKYSYHLQIIKQGSIIGNINLKHKSFLLIGRVNDLCDLFIDNPSVSRKHAILQFKANQNYPYLYDLGGTHGTQVNHNKLPIRAYQKVKPFDMIKFGVSSRYYILRCPELQHKQIENQYEEQNRFQQLLAERKKQLSKTQLKQKYLQMLENDPYFKSNSLSRKLQGYGNNQSREINGISWGISDQYQVYSYRNQSEFQLEPDILRRLPGLDQIQLNKISDYQVNFRKYEEIQSQLNQLANKQKREYGLEEKLRDKKQKLQKRFVESAQALQKSQDWIRVNIFGEVATKISKKQKLQKQNDTFEDDEFFDRTLTQKRQKKEMKQKQIKQINSQQKIFTTQDYWKLQKQLRNQFKQLINLEKQLKIQYRIKDDNGQEQQNQQNIEIKQSQQGQQQDDLDAFMKQNNENLQKQEQTINSVRISQHLAKIKQISQYLIPLIGQSEVHKIQNEERGIVSKKKMTQQEKRIKKQQEGRKKIAQALDKLDIIKQMEEQLDEEDVNIFNIYKNGKQHQQQQDDERPKNYKRNRPQILEVEQKNLETKKHKFYPSHPDDRQEGRDKDQQQEDQDNNYYDLTKIK